MSSPLPNLLVAFSKGFGFKNLFLNKLPPLIQSIERYKVTTIQDEKDIAKNYFNSLGIEPSISNFKKHNFKSVIKDFTHIIVFWDGEDLSDLIFYAALFKKPLKIIPAEITKVRNKDNEETFDIYIGRGTRWGNPFPIGIGGVGDTREQVIEKFKKYFNEEILTNKENRKALLSLRGYKLGCHCKPLACHGDILAAYLNSDESINEEQI